MTLIATITPAAIIAPAIVVVAIIIPAAVRIRHVIAAIRTFAPPPFGGDHKKTDHDGNDDQDDDPLIHDVSPPLPKVIMLEPSR